MNLPFAFEEPFFDREVHAYDLRLAKALDEINKKEEDSVLSIKSNRNMQQLRQEEKLQQPSEC